MPLEEIVHIFLTLHFTFWNLLELQFQQGTISSNRSIRFKIIYSMDRYNKFLFGNECIIYVFLLGALKRKLQGLLVPLPSYHLLSDSVRWKGSNSLPDATNKSTNKLHFDLKIILILVQLTLLALNSFISYYHPFCHFCSI